MAKKEKEIHATFAVRIPKPKPTVFAKCLVRMEKALRLCSPIQGLGHPWTLASTGGLKDGAATAFPPLKEC